MDELIFADGTRLENVICSLSRGIFTAKAIKLTLQETFDTFTDTEKTSEMTIKRGTEQIQIEGYTNLIMLSTQGSMTVKMSEEDY